MLRVIRFASRFNYHIDSDICDAVQNETIRKALKEKISRERVGIEMRKMLYDSPLAALSISYIHRFGLTESVYDLPPQDLFVRGPDADTCRQLVSWQPHLLCKLLQVFLLDMETKWCPRVPPDAQTPSVAELGGGDAMDNQMTLRPLSFPLPPALRSLLWHSVCLLPFRGLQCYRKETDKKKSIFVSEYIARESLKVWHSLFFFAFALIVFFLFH